MPLSSKSSSAVSVFLGKAKVNIYGRGFSFDAVLDNALSRFVVTEGRGKDGDEGSLCFGNIYLHIFFPLFVLSEADKL